MKRAILFLLLCVLAVASFRVDAQQPPYETDTIPFDCTSECLLRVGRSGRIYVYNPSLFVLAVQNSVGQGYTVYDLHDFALPDLNGTRLSIGLGGARFDMLPLEGVESVAFFTSLINGIRIFDLQSRTMQTLPHTFSFRGNETGSLHYEGCGGYLSQPWRINVPRYYFFTFGDETNLVFCTSSSADYELHFQVFDVRTRTIVQTISPNSGIWTFPGMGSDGTLYSASPRQIGSFNTRTSEWQIHRFLSPNRACLVRQCGELLGMDEQGRIYFLYNEMLDSPDYTGRGVIRLDFARTRIDILTGREYGSVFFAFDMTADGRILIADRESLQSIRLIRFDDYAQMLPIPRPFPFPTPD